MELIMIRSIWFLPVENYPNLRPTPQARTLNNFNPFLPVW